MDKRIGCFVVFLLAGAGLVLGGYLYQRRLDEQKQRETSDSRGVKGDIVIGVDNWVGYFPLCGAEMKKRMRGAGYLLRCVDDSADYPGRMRKLARGELNLAVATVDSFILNGAPEGFPGVIVAVLDESKGGDALVAFRAQAASIEALKKTPGLRIAFTPGSPSEHLLKSVAVHFDIPLLKDRRGPWRLETKGSEEAFAKLRSKQVGAAVLWEPDVSRALELEGAVKLLGTESTRGLIVDILVANRDFSADHPEAVKLLLANYFRSLKLYREQPALLQAELKAATGLAPEKIEAMLKGVRWASLSENATLWFGVSAGAALGDEGLIDAIESSVQILVENGDFSGSPLPSGDPYRITDRRFIEELFTGGSGDAAPGEAKAGASLERDFPALSEAEWADLREIGTLKILPITFQAGAANLSLQGKLELDKAAAALAHYPDFRVVIKGHTDTKGDPEQNRLLSQERAEAVQRYLMVTFSLDQDRLRAAGLGGQAPPTRRAGESDRTYRYRLPRVELYLVSEGL